MAHVNGSVKWFESGFLKKDEKRLDDDTVDVSNDT
jgi:hypothetical protein